MEQSTKFDLVALLHPLCMSSTSATAIHDFVRRHNPFWKRRQIKDNLELALQQVGRMRRLYRGENIVSSSLGFNEVRLRPSNFSVPELPESQCISGLATNITPGKEDNTAILKKVEKTGREDEHTIQALATSQMVPHSLCRKLSRANDGKQRNHTVYLPRPHIQCAR
jgi:hypothetical protein